MICLDDELLSDRKDDPRAIKVQLRVFGRFEGKSREAVPDRLRQPDFLRRRVMGSSGETLGFASLPRGRFAFIGAIVF